MMNGLFKNHMIITMVDKLPVTPKLTVPFHLEFTYGMYSMRPIKPLWALSQEILEKKYSAPLCFLFCSFQA